MSGLPCLPPCHPATLCLSRPSNRAKHTPGHQKEPPEGHLIYRPVMMFLCVLRPAWR